MKQSKKSLPKVATPLLLLRRIRDVMGQDEGAQARLDKIVTLIASGFSSQVCSVYLLRAGDVLELFASEGLKAQSVHQTRLGVGRGLVGTIAATAEPLNLAEASKHPKFEYRPETGEKIYKAFVGVPILQGGKVIGVLVVQRKAARKYTADQVEVLQTISMVLSELTVSGQLVSMQEIKTATGGLMTLQLSGTRLSSGIAKAVAVLHEPQLVITNYVASDINHEKQRFDDAMRALRQSFGEYIESSGLPEGDEKREIIETYLLFTRDKGWLARIHEAINAGLTAEAAVKKVQEELQARMSQMASPYIKERVQDLEDLSNHLLQLLLGKPMGVLAADLPEAFILVARSLGPAELLDYDYTRLKGIVLEEGSMTSHTAVIARAMDLPALAKVDNAADIIQAGDTLIVDAENGCVYVRPNDETEQAMDAYIRQYAERAAEYDQIKHLPAQTADGIDITLNINAGLFVDGTQILDQAGVKGIGLYRTELPYMVASDFPDVDMQRKHYAAIYKQLPDRPVIFRTFDIGGDKKVPYLHIEEEENPAMGWRATRIGLERPTILRTQFRALIEASAGRELRFMLPFIAQVSEFDAAKKLFDQELDQARARGQELPASVKIGIMIEIPSILWQLEILMPKLDFVSIGSNDLMQFLFACDRSAAHMANAYDTLSPVMLNVVKMIVEKAAMHKVEVGFCGEMARKPLDALALLAVGIRNLSVSTSALGSVKAMIRQTSLVSLTEYVQYQLDTGEASIRHLLAAYAKDHGIPV
ncbi:MAG: phosphoenolpyruvate--protein phosphotransferase [Alphaproteobacteria bacterium]